MKTLILEVDEGVYSKIKSFIELLPSELCHQVDDAELTQAETPVIHKQSSSLLIGEAALNEALEIGFIGSFEAEPDFSVHDNLPLPSDESRFSVL